MNLEIKKKCKPYPMPKINGILLKFEGFQYSMLLDINMEYYHIQITEDTSNLCIIIDPWGGIITNVYKWE